MGILSLFRRGVAPAADRGALPPTAAVPTAHPSDVGPHAAPGAYLHALPALVTPLLTEKANLRQADGWYTFRVLKHATKPDIHRAVERQFGVHVEQVNILTVPGKTRRRGRIVGRVPGYRKALVRLQPGEKIQADQPYKAA